MDRRLTEVIGVRFHGQTIDSDDAVLLLFGIKITTVVIIVVPGFREHSVGDEVFACTVRLHNRFDEVLRHVLVVRQELFGVFWETVTAVTKGRIVIVRADTRVETNTIDDVLRVETFHLRVRVEFVEIADTQREVRVREEFDSFRFGKSHDSGLDVLFERTLLEECSKALCSLGEAFVSFDRSDDDTGRVEVVVERFGLAEELGREENVVAVIFAADRLGVSDRNGRFDDHDG